MTARTCRVKGTGESGIAIWAATAVTAAINAARVMVDVLNVYLSANPNDDVRPAVALNPFYHRSSRVSGARGLRPRAFGLSRHRVERK
jgi:hypothetical protein